MHEQATTHGGTRERALAYVRVSSLAQQKEGKNLDSQLSDIRDYCHRKGYDLGEADVFPDILSGARTDRAGYYKLLARIEKRDARVIVSYEVSRIGRNGLDNAWLLVKAKEHGLRIETVTGGRDFTADPESEFMYDILSAVAKYERNAIMWRMMRGKRAAAGRGMWTGGPPPYGYALDGGRGNRLLRVVVEEASVVRWCFEAYADGVGGVKRVAELARGLDPKPKWSGTSVANMLANPVYVGLLQWEGDTVPGQHEPIVTEELWARVQRVRERARARNPGRPRREHKLDEWHA